MSAEKDAIETINELNALEECNLNNNDTNENIDQNESTLLKEIGKRWETLSTEEREIWIIKSKELDVQIKQQERYNEHKPNDVRIYFH